MAKADGSYLKEVAKLERQHLLILDDFGLQSLDGPNRLALIEIIGEKTVADAILDRLVHDAHRIELIKEN